MNLYYPVPKHASHAILWLTTAALLMVSLLLALLAAGQPVLVEHDHPAVFSASLSIPRPLPVLEPPQGQTAPGSQAVTTPVPVVAQPLPVPQPVPTPPPGQ